MPTTNTNNSNTAINSSVNLQLQPIPAIVTIAMFKQYRIIPNLPNTNIPTFEDSYIQNIINEVTLDLNSICAGNIFMRCYTQNEANQFKPQELIYLQQAIIKATDYFLQLGNLRSDVSANTDTTNVSGSVDSFKKLRERQDIILLLQLAGVYQQYIYGENEIIGAENNQQVITPQAPTNSIQDPAYNLYLLNTFLRLDGNNSMMGNLNVGGNNIVGASQIVGTGSPYKNIISNYTFTNCIISGIPTASAFEQVQNIVKNYVVPNGNDLTIPLINENDVSNWNNAGMWVNNYGEQVADLGSEVTNLANQVSSNNNLVSSLNNNFQTLQTNFNNMESEFTNIQQTEQQQNTSISNNTIQINTNKNNIATNASNIASNSSAIQNSPIPLNDNYLYNWLGYSSDYFGNYGWAGQYVSPTYEFHTLYNGNTGMYHLTLAVYLSFRQPSFGDQYNFSTTPYIFHNYTGTNVNVTPANLINGWMADGNTWNITNTGINPAWWSLISARGYLTTNNCDGSCGEWEAFNTATNTTNATCIWGMGNNTMSINISNLNTPTFSIGLTSNSTISICYVFNFLYTLAL